MKRTLLIVGFLALLLSLLFSARGDLKPVAKRVLAAEWKVFKAQPLPVGVIEQIYDMGVTDVDNDGQLDLYTANHNYRQYLFLNIGEGRYKDVLSEWKLDQSVSLPGIEQSRTAPDFNRPGLYIYWLGDTLHLRFHAIEGLAPAKVTARLYNLATIVKNDGVQIDEQVSRLGQIPETRLELRASRSSHLVLYPLSRGAPTYFSIEAPWARAHTFVGRNAVVPPEAGSGGLRSATSASPSCATCLDFELTLLDRHSMAWSDVNKDGIPDLFINRGALGGTLRSFPKAVRDQVGDELLVSKGRGQYENRARELGIEKKDCSGRHVRWVDFDQDGLLDLFINCQDRGNVAGGYPKQFYRQGRDGRFTDVASQLKLDLPDAQIIDLVWFDADGDGVVDLMTHEDTGIYLYKRINGVYERSLVHSGGFRRAAVPGLKGNTSDYWQFDGKLSVADFNGDGYLDVFVASKRGNVLLVNRKGTFTSVAPASMGLPDVSVAAVWADYDNDGLIDLHVVPEGLFRQHQPGRFVETGLLALPAQKYQAAVINWYDRDNDGAQDVVIALQENASLWRWWDKLLKSDDVKGKDDRFDWAILAYRNRIKDTNWLELKLTGRPGNSEAIGAHVEVHGKAKLQARQIGAHDGAYLSQGHYRLYFGLGNDPGPVELKIQWPNGARQSIRDVRINQLLAIAQPE